MKKLFNFKFLDNRLSLFILMTCISLMSVGFSSFLISNGASASYNVSGSFGVNDPVRDDDYVTLRMDRRYDKDTLFADADTELSDFTTYDKVNATLSWENNGSNAKYTGELTDYFQLVDYENPASDTSPHANISESQEKVYFENHVLAADNKSLTSTLYYAPNYEILDTSNTTFDTTEITKHMEMLKQLFYPNNGIDVVYGEVTRNDSVSYIKVYYTKTTEFTINSSTDEYTYTYEYHFHFFYHVKNQTVLKRTDTHVGNSGYTSSNGDIGTPSINITTVTANANKTSAASVRFTSSFHSSATSVSLNCNRYDNNAGRDSRRINADTMKVQSDFDAYDTQIRNWITSYASNSSRIELGNTVQVAAQGDNDYLKNSAFPFAKLYVSREVKTTSTATYYKRYRFYIAFFDWLSGKLNLLTNGTLYYTGNSYTSESVWPDTEILSNNANFYQKNGTTRFTSYSSITPNSKTARNYFRLFFYTPGATSGTGTSPVYYLDHYYYDNVDTQKRIEDFDKEILKEYLLKVYSNSANPPSGGSTELLDLNLENEYPFLVGFLSRYKTSSNTRYRYIANIFYYVAADGGTQTTQIKHLARTYDATNNASSAHSGEDWPSFTITEANFEMGNTFADSIKSTFSFSGTSVTTIGNQNNYSSTFSVIDGQNNYDFIKTIYDENTAEESLWRSINGIRENTLIKDKPNYDFNNKFNYYIDSSGNYHFSGYYALENATSTQQYDAAYTFNPNLYGCYYGTNATVTAGTSLYPVTSTNSNYEYNYLPSERYRLKDAYIISHTQKDVLQIHYVFENISNGETKTFVIGRDHTKAKSLFYRYYNDLASSDYITFNYEATLKVKRGYEGKAAEIIKAFNYDVQFSTSKFGVENEEI